MKLSDYLKFRPVATVCLAVLFFSQLAVLAQGAGDSKGTPGMNAAMSKWFGGNTNFIAKVEAHVLDKNQQETTTMPMSFEMLGNRIRVDINWGQIKSRELSPEYVTTMKQVGLDQMVNVLLPDKKLILTIYPSLKSYAQTAMPKEDVESAEKDYKIDKAHVGKETIDGHPCQKNDVTLTDDKGGKQRATLWNATDMKDFPIQMQLTEDENTVILKFKDVKLGRPDSAHFEAPAGMAKFDSVNALMSDAITKKMNSAPAK